MGHDEPVDLRAHRRRAGSHRPSVAQEPMDGPHGDDPGVAAAGDVPLRLAAWLAAVSQEAARTVPTPESATSLRAGTDTRPTPWSAH